MGRKESSADAFEARAAERPSSAVSELLAFAFNNKKWWLTPIILVVLLMGVVIVIGGSAAAPFIYTLF